MERQRLIERLEQFGQFVLEHRPPDGELDLDDISMVALAEFIEPGSTLDVDPAAAHEPTFAMDLLAHLPKVESPFPQMRGWIQQGEHAQVVFWQSDEGCICGAHSHPYPEWGTIVSGCTEVVVDGETRTYRPGDSFYIPGHAVHSAKMSKNYRAIDLFGSPTHVKAKR